LIQKPIKLSSTISIERIIRFRQKKKSSSLTQTKTICFTIFHNMLCSKKNFSKKTLGNKYFHLSCQHSVAMIKFKTIPSKRFKSISQTSRSSMHLMDTPARVRLVQNVQRTKKSKEKRGFKSCKKWLKMKSF